MIKSKALLGMAMLCATHIFGQFEKPREISFEISDPYKVVDAESKHYFHADGHILSIKVDGKKAIVQKFEDATMRELFRKELKMPKSYSLETIKRLGNKFVLLYSIWDRSMESEQLFYREVDFKTGAWKGPEKKLIGTRGKIAGPSIAFTGGLGFGYKFGVTDKFDFYYSADTSKMLVQYRKAPKSKSDAKNYDEIGLFVFDSELKEVWGEEVRMPYTEKKMNNIDYTVDNAGTAYILATVYEDNTTKSKKRGSDEPNYHIELLRKSPDNKKLAISKVSLEGKFINSAWIYETPQDDMVCAGFYNKTDSRGNAEGVFYVKLDKNGEAFDEQSFAIPIDILNQYESKRTRKKNEKKEDKDEAEFTDLKLRKLQFLQDGSIILIGEQYYVVSHTTTMNGRTSTYYTYHYNDLLVSKIDPSGNLAWMRKLPKSQVGRSGLGSMSFKHIYDEGYHYFMFLDDERNLNLPFDEAPDTYNDGKDGFLRAYVVDDARGEVTKENILDMRDAKGVRLYQFNPSKIMKISEDEFVFEAYKKKKEDVIVKISLKES